LAPLLGNCNLIFVLLFELFLFYFHVIKKIVLFTYCCIWLVFLFLCIFPTLCSICVLFVFMLNKKQTILVFAYAFYHLVCFEFHFCFLFSDITYFKTSVRHSFSFQLHIPIQQHIPLVSSLCINLCIVVHFVHNVHLFCIIYFTVAFS